jgi:hypothetical protein
MVSVLLVRAMGWRYQIFLRWAKKVGKMPFVYFVQQIKRDFVVACRIFASWTDSAAAR